MEGQAWEAYYSHPVHRRPSVTKILFDLKTRELESPIFVCLHCSMESQSQQAMASHCRQHVRAGMAKGTVEHIKYYPDHTYDFLCNNPQPKPQAPRSAQQEPCHNHQSRFIRCQQTGITRSYLIVAMLSCQSRLDLHGPS